MAHAENVFPPHIETMNIFYNMYFIRSHVRDLLKGSVIITPRLSLHYLPSLTFSSLNSQGRNDDKGNSIIPNMYFRYGY